MFETLKRLYKQGKLNEQGLDKQIIKNWITTGQKQEIMQ